MGRARNRRRILTRIASPCPLDPSRSRVASPNSHGRLVHGRGYLARGEEPRCGCGPDVLLRAAWSPQPRRVGRAIWVPVRCQHVGFVRTQFIYSDRMLGALR